MPHRVCNLPHSANRPILIGEEPMRTIYALLVVLVVVGCKGKDDSVSSSPSTSTTSSAPTVTVPSSAKELPKPVVDLPSSIANCKKGEQSGCSAACDGGDLPSCVALGEIDIKSDDTTIKKSCVGPLRKACDGNVAKACSTLASRCLVLDGTKEEKAALNEKACTLNDGMGCLNAAANYEQGYGVGQDAAKGKELSDKALVLLPKECDGGDAKSCVSLAMLYDPATKSKRVAKDKAKAAGLFKRACDGGEQNACEAVKRLAK